MGDKITLVPLVAGMSSRFGGEVKQFARVGPKGETLIEYSLGQALENDFKKIVFVVGDKTEVGFREMFGDSYKGIPVYYARQEFDSSSRDKPWGTIDAVYAAREYIDSPFVVCNGDDITGSKSFKYLYDHLRQGRDSATVGFALEEFLSEYNGVNRGIFQTDNSSYVKGIEEVFDIHKGRLHEKGLSRDSLCNLNLFGMHPEDLEALGDRLDLFKKKHYGSRTAECLLSTEINELIKEGVMNMKFYLSPEKCIGVTNPGDVEEVRAALTGKSI